MRIEDVTQARLKGISDGTELHRLRGRFIQLYDRYFKAGRVKKAKGLGRGMLLDRYVLLRTEMRRRGLKRYSETAIDSEVSHRLCRKAFLGIDVQGFGDLVEVPNYVSIAGSFAKSPKQAKDVDIIIRDSEDNRDEGFELKIGRKIKELTGKEPHFVYSQKGPHSTHIPVADRILRAHEETKKVEVKEGIWKKLSDVQRKECDEETAKISENKEKPEAKEPHEFKAAKYTHPNGHPRCLTCGDEESTGKVCNMPDSWYDKHEWDDEEAWEEERKKLREKKVIKSSEDMGLEDYEYLIHHIEFSDAGKEEIHHCFLYDHIGNLFKQSHLLVKAGKIHLDGKEIKEGVFHVITGLEPSQEVVWSDEEAEENNIKPKKMKAGMTLKEKSREW